MQATTQSQPATAPAQAPAPPTTITTVGPGGNTQTLTIPRTAAEVRALRVNRQELNAQLTSVASRRRSLSEEIRSAPEGASRTGLEDRIRLLDKRILQLETDIASTGSQLSAVPADLIASTQSQPSDDREEALLMGGFTLLFIVGIVAAYRRFRKRRVAAPAPSLPTDSAQRLERLEQGVEAIAIEIERISEGQRFVTRLLSESQAPVGAAHRIAQSGAAEHEDLAKR